MSEQPLYPGRPNVPPAGQPPYPPSSYPPVPGSYPPVAAPPNLDSGAEPPASGERPATPVGPDSAKPVLDRRGRVRSTRSGALWAGLIAAAIVLTALLIFVLQNLENVSVHYLGFHGRVPLGVALLLAAIAGLLLISIPGGVRILQLRRAVKKAATHR